MQRKMRIFALAIFIAVAFGVVSGILPLDGLHQVASVEAKSADGKALISAGEVNQQAVSGAIAAHGVDKWHAAGFTGKGVKVGVMDFGFQDLPSHPLSSDIDGQLCFEPRTLGGVPSAATSEDLAVCQKLGPLTPPGHGTLSVEAVHLFAPDAEVYITNPTEPIQIPIAVNWLIEKDVDVVIRTHGWSWEGAGDGKPFEGLSEHPHYANRVANIYGLLDKATESGIVWAQGIGGAANVTWSGAFSDPDGDGWHNFSGDDECNDVGLKPFPQIFYPWLRWQDTVGDTSNIRNLDFYLLNTRGDVDLKDLTQMTDEERQAFNGLVIKDLFEIQSNGARTGKTDQKLVPFPLEILTSYGVRTERDFCVAVNNVSETREARPAGPDWMQMQLYQAPEGGAAVEYKTPEQASVNTPSDSANAGMIAVAGAEDSNTLVSGSGRGPTRDGRIKPDIAASEVEFGSGHIEAAAVAGALAALVKDRYENYTPAQIAQYLKDNAADRGDAGPDNAWGHGFAMLGDAPTEPPVDPRTAAKAYVEKAIEAYRTDPQAARAYYSSPASVDRETDLYLFIIEGTTITLNGGFPGVVGGDITGRIGTDAIGKEYGKEFVAADENGRFIDYLIPDPLHEYTLYRKHTWAIKADGLIFAAGSWDKSEDVESQLLSHQHPVAAVYKAASRLLAWGADQQAFGRLAQYYNTPASIDGELYVFLAAPNGVIVADATMPQLRGTNIADLQASDDPDLGKKIAALQEDDELWITHMWNNPATGQEELKHTYVTRFRGIIYGSGYYGDNPPPDGCTQMIDGSGVFTGSWDASCLSVNRPQDTANGGVAGEDYYAQFYTFRLLKDATVTATLTSSVDTFLYVMSGFGRDGAIRAFNDDIGPHGVDKNSRISVSLPVGEYTIEATAYDAEEIGDFRLEVEINDAVAPPPPPPVVKYKAISSGANHVCAIAMDGSIMCWGDDSQGQVSDRPTSGVFTEISSGDNHTCALRDDGEVICWGSLTLP